MPSFNSKYHNLCYDETSKNLISFQGLLSILSLCLSIFPHFAFAAGLVIPDNGSVATSRGGASVSGIHDPTAGFLNPGLLSRLSGLRLSYNHNLINSQVSFTRAPSVIPDQYDYELDPSAQGVGQGSAKNEKPLFPYNGLLAMSYQLDSGLTLGFSVHGPNGTGASKYPLQGAQRYMMTELDGLLGFVGVSAAQGGDNWGAGLTLQWATMTNMNYKMVVDGEISDQLNPNVSSIDVEAEIAVKDEAAFTAILGAWFRPSPNFEVALAGRVLPVHFDAKGDVFVKNTPNLTRFSDDQLVVENGSAGFEFTLPQTARLGLRYLGLDEKGSEYFDIELALVYEAWSSMDQLEVNLEGYVGALGADLEDVTIAKKWRDTISARLGGSYKINPQFTLMSGLFFEQGATPKQYANIDFPSYDRFGGSLGLAWQMTSSVQLVLGYLHILQHEVEVNEYEAKVFQQRPIAACPEKCGMNEAGQAFSGVPANAGTHQVSFQSFTVGVNTAF